MRPSSANAARNIVQRSIASGDGQSAVLHSETIAGQGGPCEFSFHDSRQSAASGFFRRCLSTRAAVVAITTLGDCCSMGRTVHVRAGRHVRQWFRDVRPSATADSTGRIPKARSAAQQSTPPQTPPGSPVRVPASQYEQTAPPTSSSRSGQHKSGCRFWGGTVPTAGTTPHPSAAVLGRFKQFVDRTIDPENTLDLMQGRPRRRR